MIDTATFDAAVQRLQAQIDELRVLARSGLEEVEHGELRLKPADVGPSVRFGARAHEDPPATDATRALCRVRDEGPFKADVSKDGIVTAGGRKIAAVYVAEDRDALVALLNLGRIEGACRRACGER